MLPTLYEGDLVIYRSIKANEPVPKNGSVVVAKNPLEPKSLIIKRLVDYNKKGLELRGDNEGSSIDSRNFGLVNPINLCGIVVKVIRKGRSTFI